MVEGKAVSMRVIEKVADREGMNPVEMNPPLHTVIDTEALDALFQSTPSAARGDGTIKFQYRGYKIQVDSSGEVEVGETVSFTESTEANTQPAEDTIGDYQ
ncbi:HalOD1 output domain-containing protein [Natrinema sp. H-ect4]|uniref:HalOD1 output domain-containing protein n=1 Tax=Natrinema sp. H-ect4 TaxID=3242699 RepID=UPI0035A81FA7